jgi:hypothetical protein
MATYLDYLTGTGETAATLGSGALAGLLGMPYGVYKGATSGKLGTPEANRIAEEEAKRIMQEYTYQPRGKVAPEMMQSLGGLLEATKMPPVLPEAALLASIPKAAYASQAERAGMAAERAVAPMVERTMAKGGLGAGLLGDLAQGTRSNVIDPSKIKTFPKRMKYTNKAIKEGGDIAGATGKDYEEIFAKGTAKVKNNEAENIQEASKLTRQEVQQRKELANAVMDQPLQVWTPPANSLLDRSVMQSIPNVGGVAGVPQNTISRYVAPRADTSYLKTIADPENIDLIKRMINRGLDVTQGGFYKSFQPMKAALDEYGYAPDIFEKGLASGSFASARNKVAQENAIASFLMNMNRRNIDITPENILKEHDAFKALTGGGLSMMEGHTKPFAKYLTEGFPTGEKDVQKITSFFQNKLGNYQPYVLDTHEAGGLPYATPYAPVFWKQGGFKDTEYGTVEKTAQNIAQQMGLDPGIGQEGRWFGLGELTGLKTGGGDWLDNYEKQAAWSAKQLGKELTRKEQQRYVVDAFAGKERLLPWYKDEPIPDVRRGLLD